MKQSLCACGDPKCQSYVCGEIKSLSISESIRKRPAMHGIDPADPTSLLLTVTKMMIEVSKIKPEDIEIRFRKNFDYLGQSVDVCLMVWKEIWTNDHQMELDLVSPKNYQEWHWPMLTALCPQVSVFCQSDSGSYCKILFRNFQLKIRELVNTVHGSLVKNKPFTAIYLTLDPEFFTSLKFENLERLPVKINHLDK